MSFKNSWSSEDFVAARYQTGIGGLLMNWLMSYQTMTSGKGSMTFRFRTAKDRRRGGGSLSLEILIWNENSIMQQGDSRLGAGWSEDGDDWSGRNGEFVG